MMLRRLSVLVLGCLAAGGTLAGQSDSSWITWLRSNHHAIRQVAAGAPDDFSDLQFLKTVLADRRIVQIGESHHSVSEYGTTKTRLIKFLHQEMGFDVLAFKSSIYECSAIDWDRLSAADALNASIFSVWATEEMLPLFDYIKSSRQTQRPLAFVGFDQQISSRSGVLSRPAFFRQIVGAIDPAYASEVSAFDTTFLDRIAREGPAYAAASEAALVAFYEGLAEFLRTNRARLDTLFPDGSPGRAERVALSMARHVQTLRSFRNNPEDTSDGGHIVLRDSMMADHITYWARDVYPDRKIIVWASNIHVRHDADATSWVFPTMGSWLVERFRDQLYTIGLFPNRGAAAGGNRAASAIEPAGEGTMERLLSSTGAPLLFVDLLHQRRDTGNAWMFETIPARDAAIIGPSGMLTVPMVPRDQYDGILFFEEISVPRFLSR